MSSEKGYKKTVHNFYERQKRVKSASYFLTLLLVLGGSAWIVIKAMEHKPFVLQTFGYWIHILALAIISLFFVYEYHIKGLITAINEQGVFVKWSPFQKNFTMMLWEDIREIRMVESKSASGGKSYSQVFKTGRPFGIEIVSRSGRKKFISTNKVHSLPRILERISQGKFRSTGIGEAIDFKD
ncbi:MAG: hypothetical protein ACK5C5_09130 [Bacteroidota bacterium]|jgi:hypothetical protein